MKKLTNLAKEKSAEKKQKEAKLPDSKKAKNIIKFGYTYYRKSFK